MDKISTFREEYYFLSNFYKCELDFEGLHYYTSEAAFQAQKTTDEAERAKFCEIKNPLTAKMMGKSVDLRPDWDEISPDIMLRILRVKFSVPEFRERLLSTGDAYLEEGNHWHDNRWGRCTCDACANKPAQNLLGNLLMQVRDEIRQEK